MAFFFRRYLAVCAACQGAKSSMALDPWIRILDLPQLSQDLTKISPGTSINLGSVRIGMDRRMLQNGGTHKS